MPPARRELTDLSSIPRISVVIPFCNSGRFIDETVGSVLAQERPFEVLEVLIVDDKSDDPESIVALQQQKRRDKVAVLRNDGRRGPAATRNVGVRAAKGEWIAFLDADDVWLPGGLAAMAKVAAREPECDWVGGDWWIWGEDGRKEPNGRMLSQQVRRHGGEDGVWRMRRPVHEFLAADLTRAGCTLIKRTALLRIGGFCESLRHAEDSHLWMRLASQHDFWLIAAPVALYRKHAACITCATIPAVKGGLLAFRMLYDDPLLRGYRAAIRKWTFERCVWAGWRLRHERRFMLAAAAFAKAALDAPS